MARFAVWVSLSAFTNNYLERPGFHWQTESNTFRTAVILLASMFVWPPTLANGQNPTSTPVPFTGLVTNKIGTPNAPAAPSAQGSGSCSGSNYTYAVTALDFAGMSTTEGSSSSAVACTPGAGAQYIQVTTPSVIGSASCNVFRTAPTGSTGYIGNVPCGGMLLDTGQPASSSPGVPSMDQTGGIHALGVVNAQAFTASGSGAGTEILSAGSPLGSCPGTTISCIPTNAFFQQAPMSMTSGTWGITWPSGVPISAPAGSYFGPLLFGQTLSSTNASALSFSTLTNPNNSTLATASSASHAFTNGDLASLSVSSGNADFVDSTISAGTVVTSGAALTNNQAVNGAGGQGIETGFSGSGSGTAGHLAAYTASNTIGNCTGTPCTNTIGVFTGSSTWVASGEVTTVVLDGSGLTVNAGDILCNSSSGSTAHDNGSVSCASGQWVGYVKTSASPVSSATAFIALR